MVTPAPNKSQNIQHVPKSDGFSDIRKILRLVIKHWYFFVVSLPLCLGVVEFYHHYTPEVYRASVTMLFKNNPETSVSQSSLMEGFGLSPEMRSLENQSFIIRSNKMVRRAVDMLDFGVSYYRKGRLKDTELYGNVPFRIRFDSLHNQLLNTPVELQFFPDGNIKVSVKTDDAPLHNFISSKNNGSTGPVFFERIVKWDEKVEGPGFSFYIHSSSQEAHSLNATYYVKFNSNASITGQLRSGLTVTNYREGSSIIFIGTLGEQPQKLVRFLDVFSEVIIDNNLERKNDMANKSLDFIQRQLVQISDTLNIMQQRLMDFRRNNRFLIPSEMSQRLSSEFFDREKEMMTLDLNYEYFVILKNRLKEDSVDENDYLLPAFATDNAGFIRQLVMEHMNLLNEISLLDGLGGLTNPYQLELSKKLKLSKESLVTVIDKQLETIDLQKSEINRHVALLTSKIGDLPALERDYLALERSYKLNDAIYTFLLQKKSETQITKASNIPDNEILDQASVSGMILPDKKNNYSKAIMLGLVIPALLIAFKEFFNVNIRGREDLENLFHEVPIIGSIVHSKECSENVVLENSNSVITESFRSLRARLRFLISQVSGNVISITSTNTGEGKTFCAINLASVFAISGKKTALVGFDMRKPRLSAVFGVTNQPGLSGFLIGQVSIEELVLPTKQEHLFVVPSGIIPPNPSELISGDKAAELFQYLRKNFDVVIIDTPPVGLVSDARILMDLADCHLYVVRSGKTHREHLSITMSNLLAENIPCLGFILNDVTSGHNGYGYYSSGYYNPLTNLVE